MEPGFIGKLVFANVHQKAVNDERIDLYFSFNGQEHQLITRKKCNIFQPQLVYHRLETCPFCDANHLYCPLLTEHKKDLFSKLIETPNIRLDWLYIPHEETS